MSCSELCCHRLEAVGNTPQQFFGLRGTLGKEFIYICLVFFEAVIKPNVGVSDKNNSIDREKEIQTAKGFEAVLHGK